MSQSKETADRIFTISLARARPTPRYRRTDRIVTLLKEKVAHNMKVDVGVVKISQKLNEELWSVGKRSRRPRITIKASKDSEGIVYTKLPDEKEEEEEKGKEAKEEKKEKKVEEKVEAKPEETKEVAKEVKEEAKEESKAEQPSDAKKQ